MQTIKRLDELRPAVDRLRLRGELALVPTMGALHEGHLTLVREARARASAVAVSIFVNPTQFAPHEDLDAYPRQLAEDARLLEAEGVDLLWAPPVGEVYPAEFATTVSVAGLGDGLCGAFRPGHFDGVATVVAKLFNQVQPDLALFGEKDWQQLAVIRRMARDLDLARPAAERILGVPTVREADGLALSSRNRYLSAGDRERAAALPRAMREAAARIEDGANVTQALAALEEALLGGGFASVDYAELADAESLAAMPELDERPARLLVAARIGGTRLIDNMAVGPSRACGSVSWTPPMEARRSSCSARCRTRAPSPRSSPRTLRAVSITCVSKCPTSRRPAPSSRKWASACSARHGSARTEPRSSSCIQGTWAAC